MRIARARVAYRGYTALTTAAVFLACLAVWLLNVWADPYALRVVDRFPRAVGDRVALENRARLFKAFALTDKRIAAVILGSSRVDHGIRPDYPGWQHIGGGRVYNAALDGANIAEIRAYLEHAVMTTRIHTAVVGLDIGSFGQFVPQANYDPEILDRAVHSGSWARFVKFMSLYLSFDTLDKSVKVLGASSGRTPGYDEVTGRRLNRLFEDRLKTFGSARAMFIGYAREGWRQAQEIGAANSVAHTRESLDHLRAIVRLCRERGVRLDLFFTPSHALSLEMSEALDLGANIERWKREVAQAVFDSAGPEYSTGSVALWDFSGYNPITTQPLPRDDAPPGDFWEQSHFTTRIGDLILDTVLRAAGQPEALPGEFGHKLTPTLLDAHMDAIARNRRIFLGTPSGREVTKVIDDIVTARVGANAVGHKAKTWVVQDVS